MSITLKNRQAWALLIVAFITFFVNNRLITPDIMESRNIITAREMVDDGHWIVTTMNGDLRLEKPPLPTWLTALAQIIVPDDLALQRGMAGLAALLLIFYFYRFADRILHLRHPWVPTLLLLTCYNLILMGRTASWDIYCHAFMMAGIYHFARAYTSNRHIYPQFIAAGLWTALSLLSKGPVSPYALFLPFLLSLRYLDGGSIKGKIAPLVLMIVVALALGLSWYIYIHIAAPDALQAVALKESGSWLNHNVRPWYYYWKFFLEAGVWALLLLTAIFYPLIDRVASRLKQYRFALLWTVASLILLSLMPEKKPRYLLPMLIPASLLMGVIVIHWHNTIDSVKSRRAFRLNASLLAIVVALLPVAAWLMLYCPGLISLPLAITFTIVSEAIALWLIQSIRLLRPYSMVVAVTTLFLFAEIAVLPALKPLINYTEGHSIAETQQMPQLDSLQLYHDAATDLRPELVYAAHRTIRPLDLACQDSVIAHIPCAVITQQPIDQYLSPATLSQISTSYVGLFDDNRRPKGTRRYSTEFIYHLTILSPLAQH
jgi:4-amino-4-deoxy-L-arabinose transferase-like glycosyltransferase